MAEKKTLIGTALAALAGVVVWVSHLLGAWGQEAIVFGGRGIDNIPRPPAIEPPRRVVVPATEAAIKQSVSTLVSLSKGDAYDKVVYKAACASMNGFISQTPEHGEIEE